MAKSLSLTQQTFYTMETTSVKNHIGRKILRIRELRGMKQEMLAEAMGVSQQTISLLENSEEIDDKRLKAVAEALGVSLEGLKNFSEEAVFNIINNTYHNTSSDSSTLIASSVNYQPTFNTVEKIVELYERLVEAERELVRVEREKIGYLERLINKG